MSRTLSAFNAKLAEIARDYELLHENCLFLQDEVSSLMRPAPGIHARNVEAPMPDLPAECRFDGSGKAVPLPIELGSRLLVTPGVASSCGNPRSLRSFHVKEKTKLEDPEIQWKFPPLARNIAFRAGSDASSPRTGNQRTTISPPNERAVVVYCDASSPQNGNQRTTISPAIESEVAECSDASSPKTGKQRTTISPVIESAVAMYSDASPPQTSDQQTSNGLGRKSAVRVCSEASPRSPTRKSAVRGCSEVSSLSSSRKSALKACSERTSASMPISHIGSLSGIRASHWAYLSTRLLSGGHAWKIDPIWEKNLGMRVGLSEDTVENIGKGEAARWSAAMSSLTGTLNTKKKGSTKNSQLRRHLHLLTPPFHPDSTGKQIWDLFSIIWLFQDLIMVPLAFFDSDAFELSNETKLFKAVFWTADMLLSCVTGYYRKDGWLEMNPSRILQNYVKANFLLDGTIVGMDWVLLGLESQSSLTGMSRVVFRSARVLRLLRFRKGLKRTSIISDNLLSEYVIVRLGILKLLFLVFLASHYIACLWYGLTRLEISDTSVTWSRVNLDDEGRSSVFYAYSTSLHWALTQFTPASMEVVPENTAERLFACMVIMVAMVVFSSFVGGIQQAMNYIRQLEHQKRVQECAIRTFFQQRNLAHETGVKIWRFIHRHKLTDVSLLRADDLVALKKLPSYLKLELRLKLYVPTLAQHPLFFVMNSRDAKFVDIVCSECLREVQIGVGAEAFTPGSEINDMTFVIRGMLEFLSSDTSETIYAQAGDWMCELCLWANGVYLQGVFYGDKKGAELVLLNSTTFRRSARKHSAHFNLLADYAIRFVTLFQKLSDNNYGPISVANANVRITGNKLFSGAVLHSKSVLFNEFDLITSIVEDAAEKDLSFAFEVEELKSMCRRNGRGPSLLRRVGQSFMSWYRP